MNWKLLALVASILLAGCGGLAPREDAAPEAKARAKAALAERENALGLSRAASGRYGEAVSYFEAAVTLQPDAAYLHNNLGFAHLRRGALEQAVAELEEATRLDPAHPQAVANLAAARDALERQRRSERAAAARVPAAPSAPSAPHPQPAALNETTGEALRLVELAPSVYELAAVAPPRPAPVPAAVAPVAAAPAPTRPYKLEVSNGNGVRGMAHRVATRLAGLGLGRARTTNDKPFNKRLTEVSYRPGFEREARRIAALLGADVRIEQGSSAGVDVRVVLGADRRPVTFAQYIL